MEAIVLRIISRMLIPFIQLFGIYVILNGHLSPGGGFPGGVIIGSSFVLFALAFGLAEGQKKVPHGISLLMEGGGALLYGALGLVGIFVGANYLTNKGAGFPLGEPGTLFSGGLVFLLTLGIGIKVASTVVTLYYNLAEGKAHD